MLCNELHNSLSPPFDLLKDNKMCVVVVNFKFILLVLLFFVHFDLQALVLYYSTL
jgi:hypothetical protein